MNAKIGTGLDHFCDGIWKKLKGLKLGLLCNQASVNSSFVPSKEIISSLLPAELKALFTPQHGYGSEQQDNMNETPHGVDHRLGIPVHSLYSETREPTKEMLDQVDVLIVDLQDVGCRVYTFAATLLNCMKAASTYNKKIVLLDRPNPLGGEIVEGNILQKELFSFVGPYSLPMRHGLTMGEMALMFKNVYGLDCDLEIVPMVGWKRHMLWEDTGLPWIMPSPNMPLPSTAYVYPGQVIWEGTNLSEGRGTCRPFEIFGAPFIDSRILMKGLDLDNIKGCKILEFRFTPVFNKWQGKSCSGLFIHITSMQEYRPYRTSLQFLRAVVGNFPDNFSWQEPPYEYVFDKRPIDLIIGDTRVIKWIEDGASIWDLEAAWSKPLEEYQDLRRRFLLY